MWSFNRKRDSINIQKEDLIWEGPFSWPGYEEKNKLEKMPDKEGVYLLTFEFNDGYLLYAAGVTNSTKTRFSQHTKEYFKGNYTILDVNSAKNGERKEIWHGWNYAKQHHDEFLNKKNILKGAIEYQLLSFNIFIAEVNEKRKRERIEASIMLNLYHTKEYWSDLADRGMHLNARYNSEMPILIKNICEYKIYGIPEYIEI